MTPDADRRARLESLFQAAADLPPADRPALLDERCAGDAPLRAELEALLRQFDAGTMSFLDHQRSPVFDFKGEKAGDTIDRYALVEAIGEGGFGTVFRAQQSQPVKREVALKILKAGMDTRAVLARFEAERQTLARMDHPGIARVLDAGSTPAGRPYFVMDLVRGVPLNRYADDHNLSIDDRLRLFTEVCRAVQHAHQKGVIHRDLKPSNILVEEHEGRPLPRVIDFGIAKAASDTEEAHSLATQHGQLIGTPEYMSPEQAAGAAADIDTRTDVYSLGVILYELLTGALPFDPGTLRSKGLAAMQEMIRTADPPRPSQRLTTLAPEALGAAARHRATDGPSLRRRIRGDLEWIVLRATEKSPARRYGSPAELSADIERHLAHQPVLAGPPSAGYRFQKFVRRHRVPVLAGTAVLLAVIAGAVAAGVGFVRASEQRDRARGAEALARQRTAEAETERDRAAHEAARASAINEFLLQRMLGAASPWKDGRDVKVADVLGRASREARTSFEKQPEIRAAVLATLGETQQTLGHYEAAQRDLDDALVIQRGLQGDDHPATIAMRRQRSGVAFSEGDFEGAGALLGPILEDATAKLGPDHEVTLKCLRDLSAVELRRGNFDESERLMRRVYEAHLRLYGPADDRTLEAKQSLASVLSNAGKFQDADPLVDECIADFRAKPQPNAYLAACLFTRSGNANARGDSARAEADAREALGLFRAVFGDDHPQTVLALSSVSNALRGQQRYEEAEPPLREAVAILRASVGEKHPWFFTLRNSLANLLVRAGKYDEAEVETKDLIEVRSRVLGPEHPETLISRALLARVYGYQERYAECLETLRTTIDAFDRTVGPENPDTLNAKADYAVFLDKAGQYEESINAYTDLIATEKRVWGHDNPYALTNSRAMAETMLKLQRYTDAESVAREVVETYRASHPDRLNPRVLAQFVHARALIALDRHGDAHAVLVDVYAAAEPLNPARRDTVRRDAAALLADCCVALDRPEEAAQWRTKAEPQSPAASN